MIGVPLIIKSVLGSKAGLCALALLAVFAGIWIYADHRWRAGYELGAREANENAEAATRKAITELSGDAEKARLRRRLCVERGRLWSFADNACAAP